MQNWPELLKEVEKKYLCPLLVYLLYCQRKNTIADKVDTTVNAQQEDWPNIRTCGQYVLDKEEVHCTLTDQ